eukprot:6459867-Pyramimonas_sp.AAC.1
MQSDMTCPDKPLLISFVSGIPGRQTTESSPGDLSHKTERQNETKVDGMTTRAPMYGGDHNRKHAA